MSDGHDPTSTVPRPSWVAGDLIREGGLYVVVHPKMDVDLVFKKFEDDDEIFWRRQRSAERWYLQGGKTFPHAQGFRADARWFRLL